MIAFEVEVGVPVLQLVPFHVVMGFKLTLTATLGLSQLVELEVA